jgi:hypothetical protein
MTKTDYAKQLFKQPSYEPDDYEYRVRGHERPLAHLLRAWLEYADAYAARYETGIGSDYVLGPAWARIGESLLVLLNGETGQLDPGAIDSLIRRVLDSEGFKDEG